MILSYKPQFKYKLMAGTKKHTIREDAPRRWKDGMVHHAYCGNPRNGGTRIPHVAGVPYGKAKIEKVLSINIYPSSKSVVIDGHEIDDMEAFAENDGFDTVADFWAWFTEPCIDWRLIIWDVEIAHYGGGFYQTKRHTPRYIGGRTSFDRMPAVLATVAEPTSYAPNELKVLENAIVERGELTFATNCKIAMRVKSCLVSDSYPNENIFLPEYEEDEKRMRKQLKKLRKPTASRAIKREFFDHIMPQLIDDEGWQVAAQFVRIGHTWILPQVFKQLYVIMRLLNLDAMNFRSTKHRIFFYYGSLGNHDWSIVITGYGWDFLNYPPIIATKFAGLYGTRKEDASNGK